MSGTNKKLRRFRNKNSVFRILFVSILTPGIVSALLLALIFIPAVKRIARNYDSSYEETLMYAARTQLDSVLDGAVEIREKVENSSWIHELYYNVIQGNSVPYNMRDEIKSDLQFFVTQNRYAAGVSFFFYDHEDVLYTSSGIFSNLGFFRENYPDNPIYFCSPCRNQKPCFSICTYGGKEYLLYITPFRDISGGRFKGEMNILFSADKIKEMLKQTGNSEVVSYRIMDRTGNCMAELAINESGNDPVVLSIPSSDTDYSYTVLVPSEMYNKTFRGTVPLLIGVLVSDIIFCFIAAAKLSEKSYLPFYRIVAKVLGDKARNENELSDLEDAVDRIISEKKEMNDELDRIRPLARQKILWDLLSGRTLGNAELSQTGTLLKEYRLYNVIALTLSLGDDQSEEVLRETTSELSMEALLLRLGNSCSLNAFLYWINSENYRIILNYDSDEELNIWIRGLFHELKVLNNGSPVFIGVGNREDNISQLYRCASQAEAALFSAEEKGIGECVYFCDCPPVSVADGYRYTLADETMVYRMTAEGNTEGITAMINELFEENMKFSGHASRIALLGKDIYQTLKRAGSESGVTVNSGYTAERTAESADSIRKKLIETASGICRAIKEKLEERDPEETGIFAYVDSHLYDANLSLGMVAEAFGRSAAFISRLYTEKRGMNYNDYVNKARILKAMEIMRTEKTDSGKVYTRVGFASLSTFRRNFIKYAKCNPGDYSQGL